MPDFSPARTSATSHQAWANDRFKARFRVVFVGGILASVLLHGVLLWLSPVLMRIPQRLTRIELMALEPPLDRDPSTTPPAPRAPPIGRIVGVPSLEEIATPAEPLFERVPDLRVDALLEDLMDGPRSTPYAIAPELKNREGAIAALLRFYPSDSPDVPALARADVWFLIDQLGAVRKTLIKTSTGYPELDEAVLKATAFMEFSPAWAGERAIPVWISLPIVFRTGQDGTGAVDTAAIARTTTRSGESGRGR